MKAFVVDVNVAVVANNDGRSPQADSKCIIACIHALKKICDNGIIVIDDKMFILREYMGHLNMKGQPGVGDFFMKWVWENQAVVNRCQQVTVTPKNSGGEDFTEFPSDPTLAKFDRSDRKYVAVALASDKAPKIINAVDTDWWNHKDALLSNNVRVTFLCPQCMNP